MSFEIIDNTFQVIVLAAMALLAFLLAFRRSSRSCLILAKLPSAWLVSSATSERSKTTLTVKNKTFKSI